MNQLELDANQKGGGSVLKAFAWLVIISVVLYSEIMFLGIVSVIFPDGILRAGATIGAVATGASVLLLYAGKSRWFRPGTQLITAWVFTGVEVAILILNDILAFALHYGTVDSYLALWKYLCPASPVVALVGWGLIIYLDPARKIAHMQMEMEDKMQAAQIQFELARFAAQMKLQYKFLSHHAQYLESGIDDPSALKAIEEGAKNLTATTLTGLTGLPVSRQQLNGHTIESTPPKN